MQAALSSLIIGIGFLIAGVVAPMIFDDMPEWVQYSLLGLSALLIVAGSVISLMPRRGRNTGPGISVSMGNQNQVNQIGHRYGGREKDR